LSKSLKIFEENGVKNACKEVKLKLKELKNMREINNNK